MRSDISRRTYDVIKAHFPSYDPPNGRPPMPIGIYAVRDRVADMIVGGLQLHRHDAAAIRMFGDVAKTPQSIVSMHPEDFELLFLGYLGDDHLIDASVDPVKNVVLTGSQWAASQTPEGQNDGN